MTWFKQNFSKTYFFLNIDEKKVRASILKFFKNFNSRRFDHEYNFQFFTYDRDRCSKSIEAQFLFYWFLKAKLNKRDFVLNFFKSFHVVSIMMFLFSMSSRSHERMKWLLNAISLWTFNEMRIRTLFTIEF